MKHSSSKKLVSITTLPLRMSAGIICAAGAASMVDCQVLVEPGITKPNLNFQSVCASPHPRAAVSARPSHGAPAHHVRTFKRRALEKNLLLQAKVLDLRLGRKVDLARDGARHQDVLGHMRHLLLGEDTLPVRRQHGGGERARVSNSGAPPNEGPTDQFSSLCQ